MESKFLKSKTTILIGALWIFFALFPHWRTAEGYLSVGRFFLFTPPFIEDVTRSKFYLTHIQPTPDDRACKVDITQFLSENLVIGVAFFFYYFIWKSREKNEENK